MTGMVKVRLHGHLEKAFGREHEFVIGSPAEAIRALEANYPNFRREFLAGKNYYIRADGDWRSGKEAVLMPCGTEVDFVPDVEGAGLETLVASALVASGVGFTAGTAATAITASLIVAVVTTALMVGISLLLAPKPKKDTKDDKKEDSFIFGGADATIGQGAPVPLIYGRCWVAPVVISAGLETGDEKIEGASGAGGTQSPWSTVT